MFTFRQICLTVRTAMSPSYIEDFEQWRTIFVPTSSPRCLACGCGKGSNYTGATNVLLSPLGLVIRKDEKGISLSWNLSSWDGRCGSQGRWQPQNKGLSLIHLTWEALQFHHNHGSPLAITNSVAKYYMEWKSDEWNYKILSPACSPLL